MRRIWLGLALLPGACGRGGGGGRGFAVLATDPPAGATAVALDAAVRIRFSDPLDPASIGPGAILVTTASGLPVAGSVALDTEGRTMTFLPSAPLEPGLAYTASVGSEVRSGTGRALRVPFAAGFLTVEDEEPPAVLLAPAAGATDVPTNARIVAVFSEPIDPASVTPSILTVDGPEGPLAGATSLLKGGRVLRFTPEESLPAGATISVAVSGAIDLAGNALPARAIASFTVGTTPDFTPPAVTLTVNGIPPSMNSGLHLPRSGFALDATFSDDRGIDPGSLFLAAAGPLGPEELPAIAAGEDLFPEASVGGSGASLPVPVRLAFPIGDSAASARIEDLAGNASADASLAFAVVAFPDALRPFEEVQRVHVDFGIDRGPASGGNGIPDFEDDLLAHGLLAAGDPEGTNVGMRVRCRDAILAVGSGLLAGVRVELHAAPPAAPFTRIALGGIDPADLGRALGDPTTGIVGRAWFDSHNSDPADDDTQLDPPLGVFPGEMFIALGNAYLGSGPGSGSLFGQTFAPLAPAFGGTPAGAHPLDSTVLGPGFDPSTASPAEMDRFLAIGLAVERFSRSTGVVLAHELGHSFGLVETGLPPEGLHGTASKHNLNGAALDVMLSSFSWNSLALLPVRFRPINRAYLREAVVLE
ncbi:MAG TPA: Ig-like domain-containing protein [Planctomycetota bacterium]|nr:Ig-like domain-containing protein [Planctomycetota bacterium]